MRVLVVYFSRTRHTEKVARALAAELDGDLEPIREPTHRRGPLGFLRCAWEALREVPARVAEGSDPRGYELVVIGTPVWMGRLSSPVRGWLARYSGLLPPVAFFATQHAQGSELAFQQMEKLAGRPPLATLALLEAQVDRGELQAVHPTAERLLGTVRRAETLVHAV
jgi:hypothetical protein